MSNALAVLRASKMAGVSVCINVIVRNFKLWQRRVSRCVRHENLKKKLAVKLAHQSQKAERDDFQEQTNSFQSVS